MHLMQTPISLTQAAGLIAQEETWFTLPVQSPCQVYVANVTKCHQASAAAELRIVLNEHHVRSRATGSNVTDVPACN